MTPSTRNARILGFGIVALLGIALVVRLVSDRLPGPAAVTKAPDDSHVAIPMSPPPLPPDNLQQMRDISLQVNLLSASNSVSERIRAAEMAQGIGDLWRAESILRSVLEHDQASRPARLLLADVLSQQEQFEPARKLYLQLNSEDPLDLTPYLHLQSLAVKAKKPAQGWKWLATAVDRSAQTPQNMILIAQRYYALNDVPAARKEIDKAARTAPDDIDTQLKCALFFYKSSDLEKSRTILETVLQAHPDNEPTQRLLADILINPAYKKQDVARANTLLERAVALDAKDPNVYRLAAAVYRKMNLLRMSAEAYNAYLLLEPRNAAGRYGLGQVYADLGKRELAQSQFALSRSILDGEAQINPLSSAVSEHPLSDSAHAALATGLQSNGDYAGTLRELQVAAGLAPGNRAVSAKLSQLYHLLGWGEPDRIKH